MARPREGPAPVLGERVEIYADDQDVVGDARRLLGIYGAFLNGFALLGNLQAEIRVVGLELEDLKQSRRVAQGYDNRDDDCGDNEAEGPRLEELRAFPGHS